MADMHPVWILGFFTILAALGIAAFMAFRFFRKPGRLHPMDGQRERNIDEIRNEGGGRPQP